MVTAGILAIFGDREVHRTLDRPGRTAVSGRLARYRNRLDPGATCLGPRLRLEAAEATADWAFRNLDWSEIIHCIDDAHVASQAVARKLGSRPLRNARMPPPIQGPSGDGLGSIARGMVRPVHGNSHMITIYGYSPSGNCHKLRMLLAHLGRDYRWIETDSAHGATRTPSIWRRTPMAGCRWSNLTMAAS